MKLRGGQEARATEGEESLSAQDGEPASLPKFVGEAVSPCARNSRPSQDAGDHRPREVVIGSADRPPSLCLPRHGLAAQDSSMFQNILPLERKNQRHSASAESRLHVPRSSAKTSANNRLKLT